MTDSEFRRRAHALLSRLHLSRPNHRGEPRCRLCYDDPFNPDDELPAGPEGKELIDAGPESVAAEPDADAPVRIEARMSKPGPSWGSWVGRPVFLRPSQIVASFSGETPRGHPSEPFRRFVVLVLRDGGKVYVERQGDFSGSGDLWPSSPCRAIPEPWRNV